MKKLKDNIFSIVLWAVLLSIMMLPLLSQHLKWVQFCPHWSDYTSFEKKAWATNYWAGANGDIYSNGVWYASPNSGVTCSGTGSVTSAVTVLQAGNYLIANGCTMTIAATDSGFTIGGLSTAAVGSGVDGGTFTQTLATANSGITETIGTITPGATTVGLTITGTTTNNPALTILTTSVTGSPTASNKVGIYDSHISTGVVKIGNEANPNVVATGGGGGPSAYGILGVSVTTTKVYGSCVGGSVGAAGCATLALIGNNIYTLGISGLASGSNSAVYDYNDSPINSYWKVWVGGTSYMYMIKDPGVANVNSGFSYGNSAGGPLTGTLSTGGSTGPKWGF